MLDIRKGLWRSMDRLNLIIAGLELIFAIIAIYSKPKKTIKYFISRNKGNNGVLVLWNASNVSISREDIDELEYVGSRNSKLKVAYSNDNIRLNVSEPELFEMSDFYQKKFESSERFYRKKLDFSFIYPKTGYVIEINDIPANSHLGLFGRIKNEDRFSVIYSKELYWSKITKLIASLCRPMNWLNLISSLIMLVLGIVLFFVKDNSVANVIMGLTFSFLGLYTLIDLWRGKLPGQIKKYYNTHYKEYKSVMDLNALIYYPSWFVEKYE